MGGTVPETTLGAFVVTHEEWQQLKHLSRGHQIFPYVMMLYDSSNRRRLDPDKYPDLTQESVDSANEIFFMAGMFVRLQTAGSRGRFEEICFVRRKDLKSH